MNTVEQKLQKILDERGYITVAHHSKHALGSVLHACVDGDGVPYGVTLVVVGYTDHADYLGQVEEYSNRDYSDADYCFEYFHKVVAE